MTNDSLEHRLARGPRLAPPVVTRQRSESDRSRTADVFAPPFAGGRTLDRPAAHATATAAEPETVDIMVDDWQPVTDESGGEVTWVEVESVVQPDEDEQEDVGAEFPTDAFIVPEDTLSVPGGWTSDPAADFGALIADRLESLAARIRTGGLTALAAPDADELSRSIAFIVAGFYGRDR